MQGMKKHKLLREDILPSMASNRKVQRLLNEFMDLLSEYEIAEPNQAQKNSILPKPSSPATNQIDCVLQATDQMDTSPPEVHQKDSVTAAIDLNDNTQITNDQTEISPPHTNEVCPDTPMVDQVCTNEVCPDTPMVDQAKLDRQAKEADS